MTQEQINDYVAQIKSKWVGQQVKVKGNHPHNGEIGTVIDFQKAGMTGQYGLVVKGEFSDFFIFDVKLLFVIP